MLQTSKTEGRRSDRSIGNLPGSCLPVYQDFFGQLLLLLLLLLLWRLQQTAWSRTRLSGPVKLSVVGVALPVIEVLEELPEVAVIRGLKKVQPTDVAQVGGELLGAVLAEDLDGGGPLGVTDLLVPEELSKH